MKRLLLLVLATGLAIWLLIPQVRSFEAMGEKRFHVLAQPSHELVVGVHWPTAINEDGMVNGVILAQEEINAQGLAGPFHIRLVVKDTGFDWEASKRTAISFSNTPEMSAVLGYYEDSAAIKASVMYESSKLLHILTGVNNTAVTNRGGKYIVRTIVSSDKIARALAVMATQAGKKKFAVVWAQDAYGEDLGYQFRVAMDALGGTMVYQASFMADQADFRLTVNELKGTDAELIFFAGLEPWAGDFLRLARGVGITTPIAGAFSDTPEMHRRAGNTLEGAMFFDFYNPYSQSPVNQAFVTRYRARFGSDPDAMAAQGYDALHLLAMAAWKTGSRNPLDLCYAIRYADATEGANGRYKFDGRGEMEDKPIFLNVFRNGVPVILTESRPTPEPIIH